MDQTLIDEIVANVLAKLQPAGVRTVKESAPVPTAPKPSLPSSVPIAANDPDRSSAELLAPVITADLLQTSVKPGQAVRIGRTSILTPSARDWLRVNQTNWTRQDKSGSSGSSGDARSKWQVILQTVTPTVRALYDGIRRLSEGWKIELVGQPSEAVSITTRLIATAECHGVVIFTEHAELIACKSNRNDRIRAAVVHSGKQWDHVTRELGANVVCINPVGRTFMELRNLLRDCARTNPAVPTGW